MVIKLRKYQRIWLLLKSKEVAVLECHPAIWPKIKRMVSKEKDEDLAFKIINDHDTFKLEFSYDEELRRGTIRIKQTINIENMRPA